MCVQVVERVRIQTFENLHRCGDGASVGTEVKQVYSSQKNGLNKEKAHILDREWPLVDAAEAGVLLKLIECNHL